MTESDSISKQLAESNSGDQLDGNILSLKYQTMNKKSTYVQTTCRKIKMCELPY